MSLCSACVGAASFNTISAFSVSKVCYGKQISAIYAQSMQGSPFTGVAIAGTVGGDIELEADWVAKAAAVDEDKIIALPEIAAVAFPEPAVQEITGAEAPYGLPETTEELYTVTFDFVRLNADTYDEFAAILCWPNCRIWLQDELGYIYGEQLATTTGEGITDAKFNRRGGGFPGSGQAKPQFLRASVSWKDKIWKPVSDTPLTFVQGVFLPAP